MSIAKTYSPKQAEEKWYSYWLQHKFFKSVPDGREPYTIVMPPPNVTGVLHMGHMLNNTTGCADTPRAYERQKCLLGAWYRPCQHCY